MNQAMIKKLNLSLYIPLSLICFGGALYYLKNISDVAILFILVIANHLSLIGIVERIAGLETELGHKKLYFYLLLKLVILGLLLYFLNLKSEYLISLIVIFFVQMGILIVSLKKA